MRILAADNEQCSLNILERAIREAQPDAELYCYLLASEVIAKVHEEGFSPDVVFLDIEMPGMTGLELAKTLKQATPHTNIIFVTGFSQYALQAMDLRSSGYILKPVTADAVRRELQDLRYPVAKAPVPGLSVRCFGNFDVFWHDKPLPFNRSKAKELFAYLIDRRGASVNTDELCAVLWEDKPNINAQRNYVRKLISELTRVLQSVGAQDAFIKRRNSFAVDTAKIDCDYYRFLQRDLNAVNAYNGEYMLQYGWSELTLGYITSRDYDDSAK